MHYSHFSRNCLLVKSTEKDGEFTQEIDADLTRNREYGDILPFDYNPCSSDMISSVVQTIKPLLLNHRVLDVAYELYLEAPSASYPVIDLRELSRRTGASPLECRNAIVEAHQCGRFPQCALEA